MIESSLVTILVVDDEAQVRAYLRNILGRRGYQLVEAVDGKDAMQKIEGRHIDLVLTDVRMPRMDGIELAQQVAKTHPNIPVLFISGYPLDLQEEQRNHPNSICAFVSKPFMPKALLDAIDRCLQSIPARTGAAVS